VDVYAPWCGYCKEMDQKTFQDPQVQQKLSNYVLLKVNGDENPDFMNKYQVYSYPTILILDSGGNLVKTISGYQSPEDFINMI
jgi:thiol:disulfide interchange protein DsbD